MSGNLKAALGTIIILSSVLCYFYGYLLHSPDTYLLSNHADGIKNYYTYYYQITHGKSLTQFDGMNYPYSELHVMTDGNVLLTNIVRFFSLIIPGIENYSIGIYNLVIFFGFLISGLMIALILKELGVKTTFAVLGGVITVLLSPQWDRIGGHLTLSFALTIPLLFYGMIRWYKSKFLSWKWPCILCIFSTLIFFVHPYLGLMMILGGAGMLLPLYLNHFTLLRNKGWFYFKVILILILPAFFFKFFLFLFDTHPERPPVPNGLFTNNAILPSVLYPTRGPTKAIYDFIINFEKPAWETLAFVGSPSVLILIFALFRLLRRSFSSPNLIKWLPVKGNILVNSIIISGILTFLFAKGVIYLDLAKNDLLPESLMQFRALGRFTWIIYYAVSIFSFYHLYRLFRLLSRKKLHQMAYAIVVGACFLYTIEALPLHQHYSENIKKNQNLFKLPPEEDSQYNWLKKKLAELDLNQFQAIVPLPYFHVGSEYLQTEGSAKSHQLSFMASYYTGMPLMGVMTARTSIVESRNLYTLFGPNYLKKDIAKQLDPTKDLLVIYTNEGLRYFDQKIKERAQVIEARQNFTLLRLKLSSLLEYDRKEISRYQELTKGLPDHKGFYTSDSSDYIFKDFEEQIKGNIIFRGKGVFTNPKEISDLYNDTSIFLKGNREYELSFWYYNRHNEKKGWCTIVYYDPNEKKNKWMMPINSLVDSYHIDGDWTLEKHRFKLPSDRPIKVIIQNSTPNPVIVDDLLIRPLDLDICRKDTGNLISFNNERIPLQ